MIDTTLLPAFYMADERYQRAYGIARANAQGRVWLLGGYVARSLAHLTYGTPFPEKVDLDFLCEDLAPEPTVPAHLHVKRNRYGNPRVVGEHLVIDLMPFTLQNFPTLITRSLPLTIENILARAPLTIGAIAYDTATGTVTGDAGLRAVETRTVAVNDAAEAADTARQLHWSVEHLVRHKAASYGFTPLVP